MNYDNYIITGGAGFIGSNLARYLNNFDIRPIIVDKTNTLTWRNLNGVDYADMIDYQDAHKLETLKNPVLICLGANVDEREGFSPELMANNHEYPVNLIKMLNFPRTIMASCASVYGNSNDFKESYVTYPTTAYGFSKAHLEKMVRNRGNTACLRFFDCYGPNEEHKGNTKSFFHTCYEKHYCVEVFESPDGKDIKRDFIYVEDACRVIHFVIENPSITGLINVGTGVARSFTDVAKAMGVREIRRIQLPSTMKKSGYQSYTCADTTRLRELGYKREFHTIEEGAKKLIAAKNEQPELAPEVIHGSSEAAPVKLSGEYRLQATTPAPQDRKRAFSR
jgi:ADP-L-glycero-D-manno-heptose 6-epimerase